MSAKNRILVIAATTRELAEPAGWIALACGIGPIEAAAATAAAINEHQPHIILHVGIAGARQHCALPAASLVIGGASAYCDADAGASWSPVEICAPGELLAVAQRILPDASVRTIGTSARVGGTFGCDIEAMEGYGVLRAAQRANIPALEVRAISNDIEEEDRSRWYFDAAFDAIVNATPPLVGALRAHRSASVSSTSHA